jgi:hypothetical protein
MTHEKTEIIHSKKGFIVGISNSLSKKLLKNSRIPLLFHHLAIIWKLLAAPFINWEFICQHCSKEAYSHGRVCLRSFQASTSQSSSTNQHLEGFASSVSPLKGQTTTVPLSASKIGEFSTSTFSKIMMYIL